jgi:hypothetical protein
LTFRGFRDSAVANIEPKAGSGVPVCIWRIKEQDELALGRYEGYPHFYEKELVTVNLGEGEEMLKMAYVMTAGHQLGIPATPYYMTIRQGYKDCNFEEQILHDYVNKAIERAATQEQELDEGQQMEWL